MSPRTPRRAWQRMLSGRRLDLLDPTPFDIEIGDIAHGLSFVARWNGQTEGDWPYSVAEHSMLVEDIFTRMNPDLDIRWRLAALLHDAPEYVIGDMISPVKSALGNEYGEMDTRLTAAIHRRFGLPATIPIIIKRRIKIADRISARLEAMQIAGFTRSEAHQFFPVQNEHILDAFKISPHPPAIVRAEFLSRFQTLMTEIDRAD